VSRRCGLPAGKAFLGASGLRRVPVRLFIAARSRMDSAVVTSNRAASPSPRRSGRLSWRWLPMLLAGGTTAFLSLRARPSLSDILWVPRAWVHFFDGHDFLNNLAGFAGLAATVHFALAHAEATRRHLLQRAGLLALGVAGLELLQAFRPLRSCDWHDVAAGWLGVALASVPWLAFPTFPCRRAR
jgi:hypothetical protein